MADTFTVGETTDIHDKDKQITRAYTESREETFTVRQLEERIASIDNSISRMNAEKAEIQAKIDSANTAISGG